MQVQTIKVEVTLAQLMVLAVAVGLALQEA
jgi:hypothetical protein